MNLKYSAVVPVYNREQYIAPYLEQLKEQNIKPIVTLGTKPWESQGNEESIEVDRTEKILKKYFPDVKVIKQFYAHQKDSFNTGIKNLQDYDVIFVFDCDIFLTKEDWPKLINFIESRYKNNDVFLINFETMIQEYYYNYRYGKAALRGGHPPVIAIKKDVEMKTMTHATSPFGTVWDTNEVKVHHFRFAKNNGSGKHKCIEPKSSLHDYTPAPKEIIDRLKKWDIILENEI